MLSEVASGVVYGLPRVASRMEPLLPSEPANGPGGESYSPHLKTVLKTYQLSAVKSLQGPSSALLGMECKGLLPGPDSFHRFSPPSCTGNCGLDGLKPVMKELDKRTNSPHLPVTAPCKDLRVEPLYEDSDDDPPERPKVGCTLQWRVKKIMVFLEVE